MYFPHGEVLYMHVYFTTVLSSPCMTDANPHLQLARCPSFDGLELQRTKVVALPGYLIPYALSDLVSLYMYQVLTELVLDKALDCLLKTY